MRTTRTTVLAAAAVLALIASAGSLDLPTPATAGPAVGRGTGAADGGTTLDPGRPDPRPAPPAIAAPALPHARISSPPPTAIAPPGRLAPEGWLVAGGTSPVAGGSGPLVTYTVEVAADPRRGLDGDAIAAAVTTTLSDPDHGWTSTGRWRLRRIDDPEAAHLRILVAEPSLVDELCAEAGLDTLGRYSCWSGTFAALNADRWGDGVPHVADLGLYRTYLVNHEVGHGLGYGHEPCLADGALAPVMMQLTRSTEGCVPNGVPFP